MEFPAVLTVPLTKEGQLDECARLTSIAKKDKKKLIPSALPLPFRFRPSGVTLLLLQESHWNVVSGRLNGTMRKPLAH